MSNLKIERYLAKTKYWSWNVLKKNQELHNTVFFRKSIRSNARDSLEKKGFKVFTAFLAENSQVHVSGWSTMYNGST